MSDLAVCAVYIPMAVLTVGILIAVTARHMGKNLAFNFLFYTLMVLGWQLSEIAFHLSNSFELAYFLFDLKLPFVALTSLGVLIYILRFYGLEGYYSGPIVACLSVPPLMTGALAIAPHWHQHLRIGLEILEIYPAHLVHNVRGPWFWMHAGYCYALIAVSFVVGLSRHRGLPRHFKGTSGVLIAGMAISILLNGLYVFGVIEATIDFALVGATVCVCFMYAATVQNKGMDFLNRARVEVFSSLQSGMIILDSDRRARGFNAAGRHFMVDCGLDDAGGSFDLVLDTARSASWKVEVSEDEEGGTDFYVEEHIYNIREKPILDNHRRTIGAFVVVLDVTENRKLIQRLEEDAGMDALTGLFNRLRMDELLGKLDREENYPLAVIMGDMNGLKQVNDTYGHQQGDVLLRLGADILGAMCPPSAAVGRMGGDEFMAVLPGYSLEQALSLIAEIEARMAAAESRHYEVSMSLGAAVKENAQQSMEEVVRLADTKMYVHKNLYKTARENRKSLRAGSGGG